MPEADTRTVDQKLIDANFFRDQDRFSKIAAWWKESSRQSYITPSSFSCVISPVDRPNSVP